MNIITIMRKVVLVVEDDNDLLMIYKEILELNKFEVHTAENGQEGVEKFKEIQPSLVIMDGDMPVLDGYEAFNQIKKLDNNANVVIVTGMAEYEKKNQDAIKKGLIKVITKPLGIDQLVDLAQKYSEIKLEK
ncbi:response regulator [Nitrosopumilus sp. S6]